MKAVHPEQGHEGSRFVEIAKSQDEYVTLPAFVDGQGLVLSEWEFTPAERHAIANGARLRLWTHTFNRPFQPIQFEVGSPPEINPEDNGV